MQILKNILRKLLHVHFTKRSNRSCRDTKDCLLALQRSSCKMPWLPPWRPLLSLDGFWRKQSCKEFSEGPDSRKRKTPMRWVVGTCGRSTKKIALGILSLDETPKTIRDEGHESTFERSKTCSGQREKEPLSSTFGPQNGPSVAWWTSAKDFKTASRNSRDSSCSSDAGWYRKETYL